MSFELRIPFAHKEGRIVTVASVEAGLACGCTCVECGELLLAKKGRIRVHHFSHRGDTKCRGGCETALHKMAKQVIVQEKTIQIPPIEIWWHGKRKRVEHPSSVYFDEVHVERKYKGFIPDIMGIAGEQVFCVEIRVSHAVDEDKLHKIHSVRAACLEVDLRETYKQILKGERQVTEQMIKARVVGGSENKEWLYHPACAIFNGDIDKQIKTRPVTRREDRSGKRWFDTFWVEGCPEHQGRLARYRFNCWKCAYRENGRDEITHNEEEASRWGWAMCYRDWGVRMFVRVPEAVHCSGSVRWSDLIQQSFARIKAQDEKRSKS